MINRRSLRADAARGDRFGVLYRLHYADIFRFAWRRVGAGEAEDIASETFMIAWRRLDDIPVAGELPWLYAVAGNLIRNAARRARHEESVLTMFAGAAEPDHAEMVGAHQVALRVLASLSAKDRELLRLVAWEGLDARDVAIVLGCSRAAAYIRLHRLRATLESLLGSIRAESEGS